MRIFSTSSLAILRQRRTLWLGLAASVLLNAFFIGWTGVHMCGLRGGDGHLPPGRAGQERFARAIAHLDPEYQEQVREKVVAEDVVVTREGATMADLITQIRSALTAQHFDAARLDTLHQQVDQHDRILKDSFSMTAKSIAATLPDAERIRFFNAAFPELKKSSSGKSDK